MSIKSEALPILKPAENAYDSGELSSAAQQKSTSAIKVMPEIKENRTSKIKEEKVLLKKFINNRQAIEKKIKALQELCKAKGYKFNTIINKLGLNLLELNLDNLTAIENSLKYYDKKNKISENADKESIIAVTAENLLTEEGTVTDINKYSDINKKLGSDYTGLSEAEKQGRLENTANDIINESDKEFDKKIKKSKSKEEIKELNHRKHAAHKRIRKQIFIHVTATHSSAEAANAVKILDAEDMENGISQVLDTRCSKEERRKTADNMNVEYVQSLLKYYYDKGEVPPKEVLKAATRIMVAAKSLEGVKNFDDEFHNLRLTYEENGLPEFMSSEQLTVMSAGIGVGITFNENLSIDEKAACLDTWDEHAYKFDDYYDIKTEYNTSIKSYLKEHPEASKGFAELKVKYLQEYGKTPDLPKAALKRAGVSYPQQNTESNQSQKPESETKETGDKYETNRVVGENSSAKEITESIKSGDITVLDAIKICKETAYKAIFNDPDLFHKNSVIAKLYINENRKDLKKMLECSNFSSAVEMISQNISPSIKTAYAEQVKISKITKDAVFGKDNSYATA